MSVQIFKFGGASVKSAEAVKNVAAILRQFPEKPTVIVVSAMGKMTNAFEQIWLASLDNPTIINEKIEEVKNYHQQIVSELFDEVPNSLQRALNEWYTDLEQKARSPKPAQRDYTYDSIVSIGELLSTTIISAYLNSEGILSEWKDARALIKTDYTYRSAHVDWKKTTNQCLEQILPVFESGETKCVVTQGFIAAADTWHTTTLGREGSDYSAAILAYALDADQVMIWKDVPGVLNADPSKYSNAQLLPSISYKEAIELAYYGASVIHPKTIQPLQNKNIPLWVKSFVHPKDSGTCIRTDVPQEQLVPSFIIKEGQRLISIATRDFSFIVEEHLSHIFQVFSSHGITMNLMQNSAINFSVVVNEDARELPLLMEELQQTYAVRYNGQLDLVTIRHYNEGIVQELTGEKKRVLEQRTRNTIRFLLK